MNEIEFKAWDIHNKCIVEVSSMFFAEGGIKIDGPGYHIGKNENAWATVNQKYRDKIQQEAILLPYIGLVNTHLQKLYKDDLLIEETSGRATTGCSRCDANIPTYYFKTYYQIVWFEGERTVYDNWDTKENYREFHCGWFMRPLVRYDKKDGRLDVDYRSERIIRAIDLHLERECSIYEKPELLQVNK